MIKQLKQMLEREERSQAWLGRKVGVSPATVNYWFKGIHKPSKGHLFLLKSVLDNHKEKGE